ncbi:MAG: TetR/AcrR family transcriptional regulator [Bdellovibrionaceae bacterium]|nr:TetR/AcrR family transcriptional regulator [Pseudobdellovibrionaceae bacterium]
MARPTKSATRKPANEKLLEAAFGLIRTKGYSATTVDELCQAAGVTKGTFFHYFESKEALAIAAADHWSAVTGGFFKTAPYHEPADPLDRFIGYIEFRKQILHGAVPEFTCLVGTMVQEAYESHPKLREACANSIFTHAAVVEEDIRAAKAKHCPDADFDPRSLAVHTQAVLQGAFILAKATESNAVAVESLDHLIRYVRFLFSEPQPKGKTREQIAN